VEAGSPGTCDTGRRASHLEPAVHRTGRSNPSREKSVRASQLVVSWCPSSGDLGSASLAFDNLSPTGQILDSGFRTGVRPRLLRLWESVAKCQDQANQPEAHGYAISTPDEIEGHAWLLRRDPVRPKACRTEPHCQGEWRADRVQESVGGRRGDAHGGAPPGFEAVPLTGAVLLILPRGCMRLVRNWGNSADLARKAVEVKASGRDVRGDALTAKNTTSAEEIRDTRATPMKPSDRISVTASPGEDTQHNDGEHDKREDLSSVHLTCLYWLGAASTPPPHHVGLMAATAPSSANHPVVRCRLHEESAQSVPRYTGIQEVVRSTKT